MQPSALRGGDGPLDHVLELLCGVAGLGRRRLAIILGLMAMGAVAVAHGLGRRGFALGRALGDASREVMADLTDDLAEFQLVKSFGAE